jgi:hypothetical protein
MISTLHDHGKRELSKKLRTLENSRDVQRKREDLRET